MFRIEFFIDDKKLAAVLQELAPHKPYNLSVAPTANAVPDKKHAGQLRGNGRDTAGNTLITAMNDGTLKGAFTTAAMNEVLAAHGHSAPNSNVIRELAKNKIIRRKRGAVRGIWEAVK